LETIPIIKFGEKEEPAKPGDVELGSTSGTSHADVPSTTTATTDVPPAKATTTAAVIATRTNSGDLRGTTADHHCC